MTRQRLSPEYTAACHVPLPWLLGRLGFDPDARGRYWCPFHDDQRPGGRPSADVWELSHGDVFGCWSCGVRADPVELTQRALGGTLSHALREIGRIRGDAPAAREKSLERIVDPAQLEREYRVSTTGIRGDPLPTFLRQHAPLPPVDFLSDGWGWRGDYLGRIVMPWWDWNGELTGLKYRVPPDWHKDSRRRSRFRQLYGEWRPSTHPEVWLCEGETDTVWASWFLRDVADVYGLGSASQRPRPADLEVFRQKRAILALDAGPAGDDARRRWRSALAGVVRELHVVPLRSDLREAERTPDQLREELT